MQIPGVLLFKQLPLNYDPNCQEASSTLYERLYSGLDSLGRSPDSGQT